MTHHERPLRSPPSSTAVDFEDGSTLKTVSIGATSLVDGLSRLEICRSLPNYISVPMSTNEGLIGYSEQLEPILQATESQLDPILQSAHEVPSTSAGNEAQSEIKHSPTDRLIADAEKILTDLQIVEGTCVAFHKAQTRSNEEQADPQWQRHVLLHQDLLSRHDDFFLLFTNSHDPSADSLLEEFDVSRDICARMWYHGIYSFLEIMRKQQSKTMEYIFRFISFAYSLIIRLSVTVPVFRDAWNEQLGDLARYRMAMELYEGPDREVWASVSKNWYNRVAQDNPNIGRIQHHLGVLIRRDALQQLFYYTKACICVQPFTRKILDTFLNAYQEEIPSHQHSTVTALLATHRVLYFCDTDEQFIPLGNRFLRVLQRGFNSSDALGMQGVYMMSSNIASILQYGALETTIAVEFFHTYDQSKNFVEAYADALKWSTLSSIDERNSSMTIPSQILSWTVFQGASLTFQTLNVLLDQIEDSSICPSVHISLAFIWCLALHPTAMQQIERVIPWLAITKYLNVFVSRKAMSNSIKTKIENDSFPLSSETTAQQLPEDFMIQGQLWSELYYPECFFKGAPLEHERPKIEGPGMAVIRANRLLWLGVRLSSLNRWMTYNPDKGFTETQLARQFAPIAALSGGLNSETRPITKEDQLGLQRDV